MVGGSVRMVAPKGCQAGPVAQEALNTTLRYCFLPKGISHPTSTPVTAATESFPVGRRTVLSRSDLFVTIARMMSWKKAASRRDPYSGKFMRRGREWKRGPARYRDGIITLRQGDIVVRQCPRARKRRARMRLLASVPYSFGKKASALALKE